MSNFFMWPRFNHYQNLGTNFFYSNLQNQLTPKLEPSIMMSKILMRPRRDHDQNSDIKNFDVTYN
jgi:hypothetical protein